MFAVCYHDWLQFRVCMSTCVDACIITQILAATTNCCPIHFSALPCDRRSPLPARSRLRTGAVLLRPVFCLRLGRMRCRLDLHDGHSRDDTCRLLSSSVAVHGYDNRRYSTPIGSVGIRRVPYYLFMTKSSAKPHAHRRL